MYKKRFASWRSKKNYPTNVMARICDMDEQRQQQGKPSEFYWKDKHVPEKNIKRFKERHRRDPVATSPLPVESVGEVTQVWLFFIFLLAHSFHAV